MQRHLGWAERVLGWKERLRYSKWRLRRCERLAVLRRHGSFDVVSARHEYAMKYFRETKTNLGVILATAPNSLNLTWPFPLGVVACASLEGMAGSVLFVLSFLERNREVIMGGEGKIRS